MKPRFLYRGVNPKLYESTDGRLEPKALGKPFARAAKFGQFKFGKFTFGKSKKNVVMAHQKDSTTYPSSGVSTTPIRANAQKYATHDGKYDYGYVFKIDTQLLEQAQVEAYDVSEYVTNPGIPNDKEIILVASDRRALPAEIVVDIIKVLKHLTSGSNRTA